MKKQLSTLLSLVALLVIGNQTYAEAPALMSYQGSVADNRGNLLNGEFVVKFGIYNDAETGSALWRETQRVTVVNGLFSVLLGSENPLSDSLFRDPNRWLGISIGSDPEMSPRRRFGAVPYAFQTAEEKVKGDKGDKGDLGPPGPVGPQGPIGDRGEKGDKGDPGPAGPPGPQGPVGATGPKGDIGPQGIQGDKGDPGTPGTQGLTGLQGPKGDTGDVGPSGPQGLAGPQGTKGDKGDVGDPGAQGPSGSQGPAGAQGPKGDTGDVGPSGPQGPAGPQGTPGPSVENDPQVGTNTADKVPRWDGSALVGGSIYDNGTVAGIGTSATGATLNVKGVFDRTGIECLMQNGSPAGKFEIENSNSGATGLDVRTNGVGRAVEVSISNPSSTADAIYAATAGSGNALSTQGKTYLDGNVGIGTSPTNILTIQQNSSTNPIATAWTLYSSRRWKKNIQTLSGGLDKVLRLRGVSYDWKETGKRDIGLIAEEVGEVIPEIVAYEPNHIDANSVDYARIVAVLVEALKEQQTQIQDLKARMENLEALPRPEALAPIRGKGE